MRRARIVFALTSVALLIAGCGDSSGGSGGAGGAMSATTGKGTTASTGTTTSGATTTATTSSSTGSGGGGPAGDHLLISELVVSPDTAELIEIYNPTNAAVTLDNYYLSDNSTYTSVAAGTPWTPATNNAGTDFVARFPAGTSIPAGGVVVIGFDPGFEAQYNKCPDFYMGLTPLSCGISMVPVMVPTEAGSIVDTSNLSNAREMVVLFNWDGTAGHNLKDVDYLTWGAMFESGSRVDKTGVGTYLADTAPASQKPATAPTNFQSVERCAIETGEKLTGGNGISGHDETSEDLASSFVVQTTPTPGVKNACL